MAAYAHLSREQLIEKLQRLEQQLGTPAPIERVGKRPFDFSSYPRRKIALKFCYWGSDYSGLAIQDGSTPLPTVESVLFAALSKSRLVDPDAGLEGCGWSRCGRTDRGVSAAGQVVSLWVRSAIGKRKVVTARSNNLATDGPADSNISAPSNSSTVTSGPISPAQELRYIHSINQNLPPTIRALAWSPVLDDFDARFSCAYRHYKYIFTTRVAPRLNIEAMRDAASRLEGEHDFRNFCKQDPTKQIENFYRTILRATISPLEQFYEDVQHPATTTDGLYVFDLVGTAFLYHQVRHIMAVLFLIGSGHESPSVIDDILRTGYDSPSKFGESIESAASASSTKGEVSVSLPIVATKPNYRMADALPLILWDCAYKDSEVAWRGDDHLRPEYADSLFRDMQGTWARDAIRTAVSSLFLKACSSFHAPPPVSPADNTIMQSESRREASSSTRYHLGGGTFQTEARYVPLLRRERGGSIEEANAKWRAGAKGKRNMEKMAKRAADRAATLAAPLDIPIGSTQAVID